MAATKRDEPRISINALARYLTAPAAGRRRILREQKKPVAYKVIYYQEAENAISDFLAKRIDDDGLADRRDGLLDWPSATKHERQRRRCCAQAIERFIGTQDCLDLDGLQLRRERRRVPTLMCAGVTISVRPEIVVSRVGTNGGRYSHGLVKLYFSKDEPLADAIGDCLAAILSQYAEENTPDQMECERKICQVLDVFAGRVFVGPKAVKRHRKDVEAACQEIADRWQQVQV